VFGQPEHRRAGGHQERDRDEQRVVGAADEGGSDCYALLGTWLFMTLHQGGDGTSRVPARHRSSTDGLLRQRAWCSTLQREPHRDHGTALMDAKNADQLLSTQ
jgi:hypothetical protein